MPLYVKDPKVLAALQESKSGQAPYAGAFLLKDDKYASTASSYYGFETVNILDKLKGKELLKKIYQVGTLAQILNIQGKQVILVGRKRLQITEMVNRNPLTVKAQHINDKPYDKDDEVIKATYIEVIGDSNYRKLAEFLLQKRRRNFTGLRAGIFDATDFNYQKLADFGAGICGANKHKIQEVLEELDIHKRLDLVKKLVEITKIREFHASIFPVTYATAEDKKEEYGSAEYVKQNRLSDTFRKRIEPIKEKIPKHVLEVIEEELANLDRKEYGFGSTDSIYSYLDWLTALPWGNCSDENFDVLRAEKILDEDHYGLHVVKERILEFIAVANLTGNPEGRKIICLSGPPGVGKTSVARSVARALGRKFFRLAVGGLSDSSEIKGDRRVYIGATPGKMVQCLKEVGTENPLVLLDEIDKLGSSSRDPEGALLELLDPEQNAHFLDYFLDVPIDLSKIALKLVRQQASAKAAMVDLESSETAAEGSIELTNEYLRLADVLKVFEHAVGGGSTREESREVVALPLLRKPLIPGFYMPLYVKDPKVLAALQESKSGQAPYAGAFLLKDDKYASTASSSSSFETVNILDSLKGKESLNKIHQVGTLAQILSIQGEQVILIGRKRLQITEMLSEDPLTVKTHHIKDKPYDKDDEVIIKATYFEVISMLRDVLETTSLWRDQVQTYTQDIGGSNYRKLAETILQKRRRKFTGFGAGIFEAIDVFYQKLTGFGAGVFDANDLNYKKLADFGAGISGANKHKIQEVLEELDASSLTITILC
ncbi:unnamed protein product [Brassica rapa subsp. trilocularis]